MFYGQQRLAAIFLWGLIGVAHHLAKFNFEQDECFEWNCYFSCWLNIFYFFLLFCLFYFCFFNESSWITKKIKINKKTVIGSYRRQFPGLSLTDPSATVLELMGPDMLIWVIIYWLMGQSIDSFSILLTPVTSIDLNSQCLCGWELKVY